MHPTQGGEQKSAERHTNSRGQKLLAYKPFGFGTSLQSSARKTTQHREGNSGRRWQCCQDTQEGRTLTKGREQAKNQREDSAYQNLANNLSRRVVFPFLSP